jgi:hypothetical protein
MTYSDFAVAVFVRAVVNMAITSRAGKILDFIIFFSFLSFMAKFSQKFYVLYNLALAAHHNHRMHPCHLSVVNS